MNNFSQVDIETEKGHLYNRLHFLGSCYPSVAQTKSFRKYIPIFCVSLLLVVAHIFLAVQNVVTFLILSGLLFLLNFIILIQFPVAFRYLSWCQNFYHKDIKQKGTWISIDYFLNGFLYPYNIYRKCKYLAILPTVIIFCFMMCLSMIIVYEVTGLYIDISNYYDISLLFPNIWEYSGNTVDVEQYAFANTIYTILYYSIKFIIIPISLTVFVICGYRWLQDFRLSLRDGSLDFYCISDLKRNPQKIRYRTFFSYILTMFLILYAVLNMFEIAFKEISITYLNDSPYIMLTSLFILSTIVFMYLGSLGFILRGIEFFYYILLSYKQGEIK